MRGEYHDVLFHINLQSLRGYKVIFKMANSSTLTGRSVVVTGTPHPTSQSFLVSHILTRSGTGGASGIGLALVQFFASHGCNVALLDISLEPATHVQSLLSSLRQQFPSVKFIFQKCDVSSWDEQAEAFGKVYKEVGSIDVVCANAGIVEAGKFLGVEEGEPKRPNLKTLDIDLNGTLYCKSSIFLDLEIRIKGEALMEKQQLSWEFIICGRTPREKRGWLFALLRMRDSILFLWRLCMPLLNMALLVR
jgi:hypothetical protein